MMYKFIRKHILVPFAGKWLGAFLLLTLWTAAFIAMPAVSGWFLAICSVAFITANTVFSYLIPSAVIRLLAIFRTATRYFERLETHKTTLDAQQSLQLKIFRSVSRFPYFKKQVNNNSTLLENSTHGVEQILNHLLLWLMPLGALVISLIIYFIFLALFSQVVAVEFLVSAAILLFIVPQLFFRKNGSYYEELKIHREENNQALIQSFRGRIEILKYNMQETVIGQFEQKLGQLEWLDNKLQTNSFYLQLIGGLGFSYIAAFLLWNSANYGVDGPTAIGIFFGIMAQAELSEMLFSGKSEKNSVKHQIRDVEAIIGQDDQMVEEDGKTIGKVVVYSHLESLTLNGVTAHIPETSVRTNPISLEIKKGEWIALYGETGKGKTTLLNSLFYPEYRKSGSLIWNGCDELLHLPVPECVYVTQKAYLLTGTLRENFEGYSDEAIEEVLKTVDLASWRASLPEGLGSWLGENGEILSGGQRKKLLLAQALLKEPQLLVVDEPTAGISSENAIAIFRNIKWRYPNTAIMMATHLKDFENVADRVVNI